jgi:hypothetical protein
MEKLKDLGLQNIIALGTSVLFFITLFSKKVREFLLSKISYLKTRTEIKRSTAESIDETFNIYQRRIDDLSRDYITLSEANIGTQKDIFELRNQKLLDDHKINALELELKQLKLKYNAQ